MSLSQKLHAVFILESSSLHQSTNRGLIFNLSCSVEGFWSLWLKASEVSCSDLLLYDLVLSSEIAAARV